jgi:hypothetical protein
MTQNERNCDGSRLVANQTEFQMNSPRQENGDGEAKGPPSFFLAFGKFFRCPFSSESTRQSSAIRDYSEFPVFTDEWR